MHIVITGASSGIGAAYARAFARAGHTLTLVARRRELLERLARELDTRTFLVTRDLAELDGVEAFLADAERALGPIDILVNNAGVQVVGPTAALDVIECERLIDVDLNAPLRLTRAVLPSMLARGNGMIVDVASMAALAPTPGMTYYNAAKAGLAAASEALRGELRGSGVHVVTVYPGIIASTEMAQASMQKYAESKFMRYLGGDVDVLAALTLRAIERRTPRVIYPRFGALARLFPGVTRFLMDRITPGFRESPRLTSLRSAPAESRLHPSTSN